MHGLVSTVPWWHKKCCKCGYCKYTNSIATALKRGANIIELFGCTEQITFKQTLQLQYTFQLLQKTPQIPEGATASLPQTLRSVYDKMRGPHSNKIVITLVNSEGRGLLI